VEETRDWIQEKNEALDTEDFGRDLRSVQALQRKHEGVERDLAALGDKIRALDEKVGKLNPFFKAILLGKSFTSNTP